jgi:hypothetical protein
MRWGRREDAAFWHKSGVNQVALGVCAAEIANLLQALARVAPGPMEGLFQAADSSRKTRDCLPGRWQRYCTATCSLPHLCVPLGLEVRLPPIPLGTNLTELVPKTDFAVANC